MDNPTSYAELVTSLQERALEFDTHLTTVKNLNSELLLKSEKILVALKNLVGTVKYEAKKFCPVCFTREPRIAFGCGHLFCSACADRAKTRNRCPTCRGAIISAIRVYL